MNFDKVKIKPAGLLIALLISSEAFSIVPGTEFGFFHFYLLAIASLHLVNNRILSRHLLFLFFSIITFYFAIISLKLELGILLRSAAITVLMFCSYFL